MPHDLFLKSPCHLTLPRCALSTSYVLRQLQGRTSTPGWMDLGVPRSVRQ